MLHSGKRQDEQLIVSLRNKIDAKEQQILLINSKNLALNAELERKKDVELQLEDADQLLSEAHQQIEDGYFQINEAQQRLENAHADINDLEDEKRDLSVKLEALLKTCFQKSWRQVEELERIELGINELVRELDHDVIAIQSRKDFLHQLANPLYECLVRQIIESQHLGLIQGYVNEMKDLQMKTKELQEQRTACQAGFDGQMPAIVQHSKRERKEFSEQFFNNADLLAHGFQGFLDKEFSLSEA